MSRTTVVVTDYTARWDTPSSRPARLREGTRVRTTEYPDSREWHGFFVSLLDTGLRLEWVRHLPKLGMDEYRLVSDESKGQ